MRVRRLLPVTALLLAAACHGGPASSSRPARGSRPTREGAPAQRDALEKRVARLELQLLERDATIEDLQERLEDAQAEIVRAMARLPTAASRAEAASGIAEAEVALQSLRASGAPGAEASRHIAPLLPRSSAEFDRGNYGGALYLANQVKTLAASARARLTSGGGARVAPRAGETAFSAPVRLRATGRGNVRTGPGTGFPVAFAVEGGRTLVGLSYLDEWVRVADDGGRSGWIFRGLVTRP